MWNTPVWGGGASEISNCSTATYFALSCILIKHHIPKFNLQHLWWVQVITIYSILYLSWSWQRCNSSPLPRPSGTGRWGSWFIHVVICCEWKSRGKRVFVMWWRCRRWSSQSCNQKVTLVPLTQDTAGKWKLPSAIHSWTEILTYHRRLIQITEWQSKPQVSEHWMRYKNKMGIKKLFTILNTKHW